MVLGHKQKNVSKNQSAFHASQIYAKNMQEKKYLQGSKAWDTNELLEQIYRTNGDS